jgi:hypothetical protein
VAAEEAVKRIAIGVLIIVMLPFAAVAQAFVTLFERLLYSQD